jgi:hypothetical protein
VPSSGRRTELPFGTRPGRSRAVILLSIPARMEWVAMTIEVFDFRRQDDSRRQGRDGWCLPA